MGSYRRVEDRLRANGTQKIGAINSSYERLKALFGEPEEGDQSKVSMEWIIEDEKGRIFTLYDWKMTELHDDNEEGISPDELKELPEIQFNVGGHSKEGLEDLYKYLEGKSAGKRNTSCLAILLLISIPTMSWLVTRL